MSRNFDVILDFTDTDYALADDPNAAVEHIVNSVVQLLTPLGVQHQNVTVEFSS